MAYSTQRTVSDGTLQLLMIEIEFFDKSEITAYLDDAITTEWTWATDKSIRFDRPVLSGVEVLLRRSTDMSEPRHIFSLGAQFKDSTLDEDFTQMLHIVQEAREGLQVTDLYGDLDMHGFRVKGLGYAQEPGDAVPLAQMVTSGSALELSAALANASDPLRGATMVGYNGFPLRVFLDRLHLSGGAGMIGYNGRTLADMAEDTINVRNYGKVDTPANTKSTFMAAWTAATLQGKMIDIPAGKYTFTDIPNMVANNLHIRCLGNVTLKTLGAGWAWDLTAGAFNLFNFRILGGMAVEGNATSTGGVHFQAINHSELELRVYNVNGPAFKVDSGVLTRFKLTASINVGPAAEWAIVPTTGLVVDGRGGSAGDFVSACWFDVRLEGVSGVGFHAINMQQCSITGTSEHNGSFGIRTEIGCRYNTWNQLDLEQNRDNDIRIGGVCDTWLGMACRSNATTNNIEVLSTAENNTFIGGDLRCANMNVGSFGTHFEGCRFSDNGSLGMKGTGDYTHNRCYVYNTSNVRTATYTPKLGAVGTFLPTLVGETVAGALTYSTRTGRYARVSGYLEFDIDLVVSALDPAMSGRLLLTGIPIPSRADVATAGPVGLFVQVVQPTAGCLGMSWRISAGTATMTFPCPRFGDVAVDTTVASLKVGTRLTFSGRIPLADKI